jgi:hypothetical protein
VHGGLLRLDRWISINSGCDRIGHDHWCYTYGTRSTDCGRLSWIAYLLLANDYKEGGHATGRGVAVGRRHFRAKVLQVLRE